MLKIFVLNLLLCLCFLLFGVIIIHKNVSDLKKHQKKFTKIGYFSRVWTYADDSLELGSGRPFSSWFNWVSWNQKIWAGMWSFSWSFRYYRKASFVFLKDFLLIFSRSSSVEFSVQDWFSMFHLFRFLNLKRLMDLACEKDNAHFQNSLFKMKITAIIRLILKFLTHNTYESISINTVVQVAEIRWVIILLWVFIITLCF